MSALTFPAVESDVHAETWAAESSVSNHELAWLSWIAEAQRIFGGSLDGDQVADGYSLDYAYDAWLEGTSPADYATEAAGA